MNFSSFVAKISVVPLISLNELEKIFLTNENIKKMDEYNARPSFLFYNKPLYSALCNQVRQFFIIVSLTLQS